MATEVVKVIDPDSGSGYNYDSLYDWEAGEQGDLTGARNEIAVAKCRCTGGTADTTYFTIDGWTTSATQYIKIWTDPTESYRHNGIVYPSGNVYRFESNVANAFNVRESYVYIQGLALKHEAVYGDTIYFLRTTTGCSYLYIDKCLFKLGNDSVGICPDYGTTPVYITNCIFFSNGTKAYSAGIRTGSISTPDLYVYNCTVFGVRFGYRQTVGTFVCKNCISGNNTDDFYGTITIDYCASDDVDGTNAVDLSPGGTESADWDACFVDYENGNLNLNSDSVCVGSGLNLYNDATYPFQDDIIGTDRGGDGASWDIGAFEYVAVSGITGTVCFGHVTGVTEENAEPFSTWTGTGTVVGSGDSERLELLSGEYMNSPFITKSGMVESALDVYASGGKPATLKYRTGANQTACEAASFITYTVPFEALGVVQLRVEA
jgi:hypothetical protein